MTNGMFVSLLLFINYNRITGFVSDENRKSVSVCQGVRGMYTIQIFSYVISHTAIHGLPFPIHWLECSISGPRELAIREYFTIYDSFSILFVTKTFDPDPLAIPKDVSRMVIQTYPV